MGMPLSMSLCNGLHDFWKNTHVSYNEHAKKHSVLARLEAVPLALAEAVSYPIVCVASIVYSLALLVFHLMAAAFSKKNRENSLDKVWSEVRGLQDHILYSIASSVGSVFMLAVGVYSKLKSPQTCVSSLDTILGEDKAPTTNAQLAPCLR